MIPALQPGQCAICRRMEGGSGYSPIGPGRRIRGPQDITWACNQDIPLARTVHHMAHDILNRIEAKALDDGGMKAGQYLDGIHKTDLATLDETEWRTFLETLIAGYGESMRDQLNAQAAPF